MKINEPVTNNEMHMKDGEILVSRTNLKGMLTYVNRNFVDMSGFSEKELMNSNHNMVRHPDMPPAAFEDLWDCLKKGRPWLGLVKNRRKNGDFYWVEANVSPVFRNGQAVEYLSVRYKPSTEQVRQAESLYRDINSGKATLGKVSLWQKPIKKWQAISLSMRSNIMFGALLLLGAASGYFNMQSMYEASQVALIAMLPLLLLFMQTLRGVLSQVVRADSVMQHIGEGVYNDQVDLRREDEVGSMLRSLKSMQINMCNSLAESREKADAGMRIQQALDNVSSSVMVADPEFNIIYMNKSVQALFKNAETDIRKQLPNFNSETLLNSNIDIFHKNPSHQRRLLEALTTTYSTEIKIGGRTLVVTANPVMSPDGGRRGTVVEWIDRSAEVAVESEVENIVQAAQAGNLNERIAMHDKEGFFLKLSEGINSMINVVQESFNDVAQVMGALAEGDLTQSITKDYAGTYGEVKDSINATIEKLVETLGRIKDSSEFIRTSSEEISVGNNNLSQRAEQQASTLEETASSMEELTSTVKNNADNAQQANRLAAGARDLAMKGGSVVKDAVNAMNEITASSNKISEIISVIDEIAFQTNLLALNASVEAARAGDQGRGFAVVASEVRNLAQRSAGAAKEIKELIKDSGAKVETGGRLVNESGITLTEIVDGVKKVGDIISEIAAASQEQSTGIEEINKAVTQLDEITQQNAALAEEASASSESSLQRATEMNEMIAFFKIAGDQHSQGGTRKPAASQRPAVQKTSKTVVQKPQATAKRSSVQQKDADDEWEEF